MNSNIINIVQIINILLSLLLIISKNKKIKQMFLVNCLLIISCFIFLAYKFAISDFSIKAVFFYSSSIQPFIYKLSASWANYDGSIMLWLGILSLISANYMLLVKNRHELVCQIKLLSFIQLLFLLFIYFVANPFDKFSFSPSEGIGLNPMLQDIAISFHPPILYLGMVCYIIHFVVIGSILLRTSVREENLIHRALLDYIDILIMFSRLGVSSLIIGILTGSWWAYRELGFGGFWFFDPVENISLLTCFIAIALHHTLIIWKKKKSLNNWLLFLCLLNFLLVIFSIFLARSGLLTSVHSFAFAKYKSECLLIILLILISFSLFLVYRVKFFYKHENYVSNITSKKELGIKIANIIWISLVIFLITTLIYPNIYQYYTGLEISINTDFFIYNFLPIFIPLIIICGATIQKNNFKENIIICISFIVLTIILIRFRIGYYEIAFILSATYLVLKVLFLFINKTQFFSKPLSINQCASTIGHFGFALLVISITLNSAFKIQIEFIGKIGDSINLDNFKVTLNQIRFAKANNYYKQIAEFEIQDEKKQITLLKPENRFYTTEKSLSMESDIFSYLFYDLYAVLHKVDEEMVFAYIYYQPFISFIWISLLVMAFSFLLNIRTYVKKV